MVQKLRLFNYRNVEDKVLSFSPQTTVIVGPNAAGKTNILESIHLVATGKSFRARVEEEMIREGQPVARVKGKVATENGEEVLEVVLTRGVMEEGGIETKVPRKRLLVNNVAKRLVDFSGFLKVVLFRPEDMDIVTGSPSVRRNFLDTLLSQIDKEYYRSLLSYEKGLRRRNKLLWMIREEGVARSQLMFWDMLLIKNGDYIARRREEFIEYVNSREDGEANFALEYDRSAISESRLAQYASEEVAAATTLVGPHRDDFAFFLEKRDLARFGSRGESRMGVLWLKMAELSFIESRSNTRPTLLLDDIFSELDHSHRDLVMQMSGGGQTIITTADPHFVVDLKPDEVLKL